MKSTLIVFVLLSIVIISGCVNQGGSMQSEMKLDDVTLTWLGHSSFRVNDGTSVVYFDPFVLDSNPKQANFILITHDHFDHCSPDNIKKIQKNDTKIITTLACLENLSGLTNSIRPGEAITYTKEKIAVDGVFAYNINKSYHPRSSGVGMILTIGGKKIYHAGDTDFIPEMVQLVNENVDVALLPIGGTYTMTVEEAAKAAMTIKPKIVIPIHYNSDKYGILGINADPQKLAKLLEGSGIDVKILKPLV